MSAYKKVFTRHHVILPVIHTVDAQQAIRNAAIAFEAGADGIFLINHDITAAHLIGCYAAVRGRFPNVWVGINFVDHSPVGALQRMPADVDGVWCDNGGVTSLDDTDAIAFRDHRALHRSHWLYFGGVAFKHQKEEGDPATAAQRAIPFMDVITTSGARTGTAPPAEKVACMKRAVGSHPVAVASGVSTANIDQMLPWADCFLVASSILRSGSFTEFDPRRVRELVQAVH